MTANRNVEGGVVAICLPQTTDINEPIYNAIDKSNQGLETWYDQSVIIVNGAFIQNYTGSKILYLLNILQSLPLIIVNRYIYLSSYHHFYLSSCLS